MELMCESHRDRTSKPHPSSCHWYRSGPTRLALRQDLLSHLCAMIWTQHLEVPWGQNFTFPKLQNMDHLMTDCMLPCPDNLIQVSECTAHRDCCIQFKLALLSLIFSSNRLPSSRKLSYQTYVSSSFSLYCRNRCPERMNQKAAHSFSSVHRNRRQNKVETTTQ